MSNTLKSNLFWGFFNSVMASISGGYSLHVMKHVTGPLDVFLGICIFVGSAYLFHLGTVCFNARKN